MKKLKQWVYDYTQSKSLDLRKFHRGDKVIVHGNYGYIADISRNNIILVSFRNGTSWWYHSKYIKIDEHL